MRHARRLLVVLLAVAAAAAAPARAQHTETQALSLTVPPAPAARAAPSPVALPNRSVAQPVAAPLPRRLAYTGTDPLPLIFGGAALSLLSLLARRRTRARAGG